MTHSQPTILIIESNVQAQQTIDRMLQKAGYHTLLAERGLAGLDIARNRQPDLILTNITLTDLTGFEIATTLRANSQYSHIPIVAMSRQPTPNERERAFATGMNGYLEQPIQSDALIIQLEFFLSGGTESISDDARLTAARDRYLQDVVKQLESRLRAVEKKNADLEQLESVKDTFIQLAAHELRTPLTLITAYSSLLDNNETLATLARENTELGSLLSGLTHSIHRMQTVVEEILTFSRIMSRDIELDIRSMKLARVVQNALSEFDDALQQRQITMHFNPDEFPDAMRGDKDLLTLTLQNLISNAIKATPDNGDIYIEAEQSGSQVHLRVRDTGVGIDPDQQETIFEHLKILGDIGLHSTSKTNFGGGGLGLGLAICRGIIESHGGSIHVESSGYDPETLPGSEFIITLPQVATPQSNHSSLREIISRS